MAKDGYTLTVIVKCFKRNLIDKSVCELQHECSSFDICNALQVIVTWSAANSLGGVFVRHVQDHFKDMPELRDNPEVICKICGKTAMAIYIEAGGKPLVL